MKHANEQKGDLCLARFVNRTQLGVWRYNVLSGLSASRKPCAVLPLTACSQPAIQAKLQASATYPSDACAGTEHVADPLAVHWLMFRSRVDQRHWSTLVVAPKCWVIKREETVRWLNLFIACNKAVRSASKSTYLIVRNSKGETSCSFRTNFVAGPPLTCINISMNTLLAIHCSRTITCL